MKKLFTFGATAIMLAFSFVAVGCSDDDKKSDMEGSGSKLPISGHRMFILNEGFMDSNNSTMSYFNPETGVLTPEIFLVQNEILLGDMAMDMVSYNNNIYVSVFGSNYLLRLNNSGVIIESVYFSYDPELTGGVRYLAANDGYIYASFYGGIVAKIDASTLEVVAKLKGVGANLEGVAIEDNKLYVADSYEIKNNPDTGVNDYIYNKEVKVIDLSSFSVSGSIEVVQNPNLLLEEDDTLFLISYDYFEVGYPFQAIDLKTGTVTQLGYATQMAAGDDIIYLVDSRTDYTTNPYTIHNTFYSYDTETKTVINESYLKDAPAELDTASVFMISVDPKTGEIYIGTTIYSAGNGTIYRFSNEGKFISKFDCGGQNPCKALFFD